MGTQLKHPPVYFTVAQVRFNPILALPEKMPVIQDAMREAGYPDFSKSVVPHFVVANPEGQPAAIQLPGTRESFLIGTTDRTHVFVLSVDALTLQSTDYGTYDAFSKRFLDGLALVHKLIGLAYVERIGLRYLDHVRPAEAEGADALAAYLIPEALGFGAKLPGQLQTSFSEALNRCGDVLLRSRVFIDNGPLSFPPDLLPTNMAIAQRFLQRQTGWNAALDNDGFVEGRSTYDHDDVTRKLDTIHGIISDAFKRTVTKHAVNAWSQP